MVAALLTLYIASSMAPASVVRSPLFSVPSPPAHGRQNVSTHFGHGGCFVGSFEYL
ncbi:hypothetical protein OF83DRAFT_1156643 [Amylostereum chailletii]|nr:hypothetical protein OF83DRAFT_1156643 [Amylostereum chailletii]